MKTYGTLRYAANPAFEGGFREGTPGARWALMCDPHVMIKVKRLFPRCDPYRDGYVMIADSPEVAHDLEWLLLRYPMEMDEPTSAVLRRGADEHRSTAEAVHAILTGQRQHLEFREPARPAREYQLIAADLALTTGNLLLTDELGLGKTCTALLVLREPRALPALVVCPTHLPFQWVEELRKTLPWLRAHIVRKMQPYDPREHRSMRGHDPDVLIIPYSKLRGWGDHLAGRVNTVIFDEVQELRCDGTQKWTAAARVADLTRYRLGLSATPVYNYAGEIHTIMEVIAPGKLGSRAEFLREWSGGERHTLGGTHITVADPAALGVYLRSEGLMLRRTRKEVGRELPEVVRVPHSVDIDEGVLEELIEEAVDLAEIIIAREVRRQELWRASGEFDWQVRRATGIAKAPYVAEFVKLLMENEEQVVLFGWHRDVYAIWQRKLMEYLPVMYTGTESPAQKKRSAEMFLSGESRVLLMSLRSGSGLDGLQEAAHVAVFGELDWSPGVLDQCIGRLHRDGQDDPVVAYYLVSEHGSDPVMAEMLNIKRMQSEPLQDPDVQLFKPVEDTSDRVRRLAADVLERRKRRRGNA